MGKEGEDFCIETYSMLAESLVSGGVDAFLLETMSSWEEAWCAIRGVQKFELPIMLSFEGACRGLDKTPQPHLAPEHARRVLKLKAEGVPIQCLGFNCAEPEIILKSLLAIKSEPGLLEQLKASGLPLLAYANLHYREATHSKGFDARNDTRQVVLRDDLADDAFSGYVKFVEDFVQHGATLVGGCCGC